MRNQRGITLIALVITIIVLLILAGVSIAMLTGDNGILSNATRSVAETNIAEDREAATLDLSDAYSDYMEARYVDNDNTSSNFVNFLLGGDTAAATATTVKSGYLEDIAHYEVSVDSTSKEITITTKSTNEQDQTEKAKVCEDGGITSDNWINTSASFTYNDDNTEI